MTTNTKAKRFSPGQLGCIVAGLLWMIAFLYFWLFLGMSIENIFDLTVIGVSLASSAVVGFLGFVCAFGVFSALRQQEDPTRRDE